MVEHSAVNRRVVGSSPTGGATKGEPPSEKVAAHFFYSESQRRLGPLAQLVEHLTLNQGVQGSSP